ncbi:hypothetical protein LTR10_011772 [Elasticomyces elasticus]|uniref:AB hydrolase-1 domain-containing protein n=1 Tax=Exophiala sideris TaxID=1016849 RepID=A0ABR0JDG8_9EURO|nr:hypothetical protein LTR10_011772 [Elasticomyces elasticus]KAK5031771.1 hypothetical protein LTS07_004391 [Exophiala sideris]KAK5040700.1 hypothetical protein LTR13_003000 [Exophiala sideris]KAK5061966.1 hypothetical protein LTR69_005150 [Exophiala sideris]KAK5184666.1 hypothetical protein LTR44_003341 [Eurotiomycetes sp. CCFEE 6388]
MGLTAAEIMAHPAYNTVEWDLPPTKKGTAQVANGRPGGPFNLYWEVHGTGPTKLVFLMGLGGYRTAWKRQTKYFGHERSKQYSSFVYDNRGMGLSDKPTCRYTTTEMAKDTVDLLQHIGWVPLSTSSTPPKRDLHVIGVSMGGMIAQEVALLIPQHVSSLSLVSTAPRLVRTIPFIENLRQRINMFIPRDIDIQLDETAHRLFSDEFLTLPDTENPKDSGLNFPTNRDRFAAGELSKRLDKEGFTRKGFILQAVAAGWHFKSVSQVKQIGDMVGRPRIAVLHGTKDRMITFNHAEMLKEQLGEGIEYKVWDGRGHVLLWEVESEFNGFLEEFFTRCEMMES